MNVCKNCGAAFEGKFCPECGTKREENPVCPQCGVPIPNGARFCNQCGFALQNGTPAAPEVTTRKDKEPIFRKIYVVLRHVPAALFALYSVLLFTFMGGQGAVANVFGLTENGGNIYSSQLRSNVPGIDGVAVTLIVSAVLGAALTAMLALSVFWAGCKGRRVTLKKYSFLLEDTLSAGAYILYLLNLIAAAILMGKVNAYGEEMAGVITAGAAPKLIIAFAVVFAVLAAGAMAGRRWLGKMCPAAIADQKATVEDRCVQATAAWDRARKERLQTGKPALAWAHSYVRLRRAVKAYFLYMLIVQVCIFGIIGNFLGFSVTRLAYALDKPYWMFLLPLLFTGVGIITAVIAFAMPVKNWTPFLVGVHADGKKGKHCSDIRRFAGFVGGVWLLIDLWFGFTRGGIGSVAIAPYVVLATLAGWIACTGCVLLGYFADARRTEVAIHYYGDCKPKERKRLLVPFDAAQETQNFAAYRGKKETYTAMPLARAGKGKAAACVGLAFLLVAITVFVAVPSTMDIFSVNYMQKMPCIEYGNAVDESEMQRFFGKPDVIRVAKRTDGSSSQTYAVWEYYGNKQYRSIAKEANKLEEEADNILAKSEPTEADAQRLAEIEARLAVSDQNAAGMQSVCLRIDWKKEYASITLDTKYRHGVSAERKQVKKVQLTGEKTFGKSQLAVTESTNFATWAKTFEKTFAKVWYTDGSYRLSGVPETAFEKLQNAAAGKYEIVWSDSWGEYSAMITVTE